MKTREIILILLAAAFGGVAIVTWSGEEAANERAAKISKEASEARLKNAAELARLRDGSELKEALARQKKAEADLEAASSALREANAKAAAATTRLAEVEEENRRLREQAKGADNVSPNYRAL